MSKKGRRGKRVFPIKYASDYINTSQRPRALVSDLEHTEGSFPRCIKCGYKYQGHIPDNEMVRCTACHIVFRARNSHDHWFDNQARVRTVVGPAHNKEPVLFNSFMEPIPPTRGRVRDSYFDWNTMTRIPAEQTPRQVAQEVRRVLRQETHTIEDFNFVVVGRTKDRVTKLFFSGNHYYWVEEYLAEGYYKKSTLYVGKMAASRAYEAERILWNPDRQPLKNS